MSGRRCPACDAADCVPRYRLPHGSILECPRCGSAVTDYAQADGVERAIGQWYADRRLLINRVYTLPFSRAQARRRARRLERHLERGRVLELGSGDGAFAHASVQAGFEVVACDRFLAPMPENRSTGVRAVLADAARLPFRGTFDAAAAFHMVGHLEEPAAVLCQLRERLRAGGIVYIETPNYGSFWRRLRGASWANLYAAYACHLSAHGLERLLSRCGFRVRERWTHETALDLLGAHYYSWRNRAWSALKSLRGRAGGPGEPAAGATAVPSSRLTLYRLEAALALRLFCLPAVPMARLASWLGRASFVSVIAERSDA
jgi:SAM-dependent methyltransferase